jgi:hypothetical protein
MSTRRLAIQSSCLKVRFRSSSLTVTNTSSQPLRPSLSTLRGARCHYRKTPVESLSEEGERESRRLVRSTAPSNTLGKSRTPPKIISRVVPALRSVSAIPLHFERNCYQAFAQNSVWRAPTVSLPWKPQTPSACCCSLCGAKSIVSRECGTNVRT